MEGINKVQPSLKLNVLDVASKIGTFKELKRLLVKGEYSSASRIALRTLDCQNLTWQEKMVCFDTLGFEALSNGKELSSLKHFGAAKAVSIGDLVPLNEVYLSSANTIGGNFRIATRRIIHIKRVLHSIGIISPDYNTPTVIKEGVDNVIQFIYDYEKRYTPSRILYQTKKDSCELSHQLHAYHRQAEVRNQNNKTTKLFPFAIPAPLGEITGYLFDIASAVQAFLAMKESLDATKNGTDLAAASEIALSLLPLPFLSREEYAFSCIAVGLDQISNGKYENALDPLGSAYGISQSLLRLIVLDLLAIARIRAGENASEDTRIVMASEASNAIMEVQKEILTKDKFPKKPQYIIDLENFHNQVRELYYYTFKEYPKDVPLLIDSENEFYEITIPIAV
ncbi:MAG: hypothetical protein ACM3KR_09395 [Deltaproteobacteria bacterium]